MSVVSSPQPEISHLDYYRIVRGQIEHEDNLVGNRLNWFLSSQSFLFTAYAITVNGIQQTGVHDMTDQREVLLVIIPVLAGLTCLLMISAILSGVAAMSVLRRVYTHHALNIGDDPLPPVQGFRYTQFLGIAAPVLIPPLFLTVWIVLLVRRLMT